MLQLPRSKTVWLLRTPAPFRSLATMLFLVGVSAALMTHVPALENRARLAEALMKATAVRIEPMVEYANTGRWPGRLHEAALDAVGDSSSDTTSTVTAHGVDVLQSLEGSRVSLSVEFEHSRGDTLLWRCRLRAVDAESHVLPLSAPSMCAE
jgi:hypothetical protein